MTSATTVLILGSWAPRFYTSITYKTISLGRKIVFAPFLSVKTTLRILKDCKVSKWNIYMYF